MLGAAGAYLWEMIPKPRRLRARLAAGANVEFSQDRRDMMIDGLLCDDQALGDLRIAQSSASSAGTPR
jgi:hypothetical protein